VLPGPPVPTVPIQTAVVIQTAVAQGTPFPPAVQTQVAVTPAPVQPGLPGTGASTAASPAARWAPLALFLLLAAGGLPALLVLPAFRGRRR
jgi:hypothetical protein